MATFFHELTVLCSITFLGTYISCKLGCKHTQYNALGPENLYVVDLKKFVRFDETESNILPIMMRFKQFIPALNITCILIGSQSHLNFIEKQVDGYIRPHDFFLNMKLLFKLAMESKFYVDRLKTTFDK